MKETDINPNQDVIMKPVNQEEKKNSKEEWKKQNALNKKLKFTYKEEKEYETIETDIALLEEKIEEKEAEILKNARDFGKLNALTIEKDELSKQLDEKMSRWMYLEELAEERQKKRMGPEMNIML